MALRIVELTFSKITSLLGVRKKAMFIFYHPPINQYSIIILKSYALIIT